MNIYRVAAGSCGPRPTKGMGVLGSQEEGLKKAGPDRGTRPASDPHPNHLLQPPILCVHLLAPGHPRCFHNSALLNLEFMPSDVVCKIIHVGEYETFSGA